MTLVIEEPNEKSETKHREDEPSLHRIEVSQNRRAPNYCQYISDGIECGFSVKSPHPLENSFTDSDYPLHRYLLC